MQSPISNFSLCSIFGLDCGIVNPGSRLEHIAHVYIADGKPCSVALDKVDLTTQINQNSYYKLQLLESDEENPRR